jgi:hypothetical protein
MVLCIYGFVSMVFFCLGASLKKKPKKHFGGFSLQGRAFPARPSTSQVSAGGRCKSSLHLR